MNFRISIFDLITLIGITTGFTCSLVLLFKSRKKRSNKFLALGILSFIWLTTKVLILSLDLWEIHGIGFFPNSVELAFAPLFYFYTLSLLDQTFQLKPKDYLHFLPFLISQSYSLIVYIHTIQTSVYSEKLLIAQSYFFNEVKAVDDYLLIPSSILYFYLGFTQLQEKTNNFKLIHASISADIRFLKNLLFLLLFLFLLHLSNLLLNNFLDYSYDWRWNLSHAIVALIVYYMAIIGFKNADILLRKKSERKQEDIDINIIDKIEQAILEEKMHLNARLSISEFARNLEIEETVLSNAINTHYQKNFKSFINQARVNEVKSRLLRGDLENFSLLGIAKECGFNSEASFYRIFKNETQSTPKQFINNDLIKKNKPHE